MRLIIVFALLLLPAGFALAANGDLMVNGNLTVGTENQPSRAEINGAVIVNGNIGINTPEPQSKLDVNGGIRIDPKTTWTSAAYDYHYSAPPANKTFDLGYHSFCALGYLQHDGGNGGWCNVFFAADSNTWKIEIGKWGNGGIACRANCLN